MGAGGTPKTQMLPGGSLGLGVLALFSRFRVCPRTEGDHMLMPTVFKY